MPIISRWDTGMGGVGEGEWVREGLAVEVTVRARTRVGVTSASCDGAHSGLHATATNAATAKNATSLIIGRGFLVAHKEFHLSVVYNDRVPVTPITLSNGELEKELIHGRRSYSEWEDC